ncbi:uncharacterized protein LOC134221418 [Armigeres subalbatus]|uniref:uncharacterized protein LOC134221418 n=1 Tax=Armigeres subalbatus TaxID=124917 RepID=UPI002ED35448
MRYRDQFERIVSCKPPVDEETKLTGLKIFAGDYLLSIIEMQQKSVPDSSREVYRATIKALDKYFSQSCDVVKERMKFRELRMKSSESFPDFVLRLETQAKFCDFGREQREEEFVQALLRRSVPGISEKLYEMSDFFENDLERIVNHGKHLDYIRTEAVESKVTHEQGQINDEPERDVSNVKAVNAIHTGRKSFRSDHHDRAKYVDGRNGLSETSTRKRPWDNRQSARQACPKCGSVHGPRDCKAFRAKCYNCGKLNHFAEFCYSSRRWKNARYRLNADLGEDMKKEAGIINQVDSI